MGKILRRCTICKRFHASYLVEDPIFGKGYLCYDCWKARQEKATLVVESTENKSQKAKKFA